MLQTALSRRPSLRLLPMILAALGLQGCATFRAADAPGCSGPRRPANPHGTVLAPDAAPPTAPATGGACARGRS